MKRAAARHLKVARAPALNWDSMHVPRRFRARRCFPLLTNTEIRDILRAAAKGARVDGNPELARAAARSARLIVGRAFASPKRWVYWQR